MRRSAFAVEGHALSWPAEQSGRDGALFAVEGHALSWPAEQKGRDGARPSNRTDATERVPPAMQPINA
jgi:hypothetical protein